MANPGFPIGVREPFTGDGLFENERIRPRGGGPAPEIFVCRSATQILESYYLFQTILMLHVVIVNSHITSLIGQSISALNVTLRLMFPPFAG